jgi:hypothetical protein
MDRPIRMHASVRVVLLVAVLWLTGSPGATAETPASSFSLDIQVLPDGLARVYARLELPGPPEIARAVLTDYEHWPDLFPPGLRIVGIRREAHGVITDLWASRHILPGELHLITETREPTPGLLETTLIEGDFHRYTRSWRLSPDKNGQRTTATLEMELQPKDWVPDWLFTTFLRRDLEAHFVRLQAAVSAQARH